MNDARQLALRLWIEREFAHTGVLAVGGGAGAAAFPVYATGELLAAQNDEVWRQVAGMIASGPMHLAAALDVPQLAIFGSTSEVATGPFNRHATVIKHPVECNPCFLRKCPTDFRCMTGISIQQVIDAAQIKLEEGKNCKASNI